MQEDRRTRVLEALSSFLSTPLDAVLTRHLRRDPREEALALFHRVAASVPAYRRFLGDHGVDPTKIRSFADFEALPETTKQGYILCHPLADLCRGGELSSCDMVAVSSGSTGKPTFWPRFFADELGIATRFEQIFRDSFQADQKRTLAVICFALGTWVGGMYTASCCRHLGAKSYPITVVTPGNNKDEIYRVLADLGPSFEQVVLLGYPPFLKDVIDTGLSRGVDFATLDIKLVMAGEVFSEEFRSLVLSRAGASSPCYASASLYGTADAGVLGNETPLSIAIRRFLSGRPDVALSLFGQPRLPTLVQFDPQSRFFEAHEGRLLFSGDNGVPLIRYGILDAGGVIPFSAMLDALARAGFDPREAPEIKREGGRGVRDLPFVYVFGRADFTVSYFGANIYPENVTVGLEQPGIHEWVTGKFVLEVVEGEDKNQRLSIVVELLPGASGGEPRARAAAAAIEAELLRLNSEFKSYVPEGRRTPEVRLVAAGDPAYFPVGVKHRYTRK